MIRPMTPAQIRRARKLDDKWEALKTGYVDLLTREASAANLGFADMCEEYRAKQRTMHAGMKRFCKRHGWMDKYRTFFGL